MVAKISKTIYRAIEIAKNFINRIVECCKSPFSRAKNTSPWNISTKGLKSFQASQFNENETMKALKALIKEDIKTMNFIIGISGEINKQFLIEYNENAFIDNLLLKCAQGCLKLSELELSKVLSALRKESEPDHIDDVQINARFCWFMAQSIIAYHCLIEEEKENLSEEQNDMPVSKISGLDETINELEKMMEEFFFPLFRILLDTDSDWQTKAKLVKGFFGYEMVSETDLALEHLNYHRKHEVSDMVIGFCRLQGLLEYLNQMKDMPKSAYNLNIVMDFLITCCDHFSSFPDNWRNFGRTFSQKSHNLGRYGPARGPKVNVFFIRSNKIIENLANLKKQFSSEIEQATKKEKLKAKAQVRNYGEFEISNFSQKKETKRKKIIKDNEKDKGKSISQETPVKKIVSQSNKPCSLILEKRRAEAEAISKEPNPLLKTIRQICKENREGNLARSGKINESEKVTKVRLGMVVVEKLNGEQEETLRALCCKNPPHLKIKGSKVESLITNGLKSRVEEKGTGDCTIFWGNSKKIAGTYEVTHGRDRKKRLTSDYAAKIGNIIKEGIDQGFISIPPSYLNE